MNEAQLENKETKDRHQQDAAPGTEAQLVWLLSRLRALPDKKRRFWGGFIWFALLFPSLFFYAFCLIMLSQSLIFSAVFGAVQEPMQLAFGIDFEPISKQMILLAVGTIGGGLFLGWMKMQEPPTAPSGKQRGEELG